MTPGVRWSARAWALFAYLAVLAVVAGIVVFAVRYQPLTAANFTSGPVTSSGANVVRVGYADGGTFSFGFLLVNDGPLPVKIPGHPGHRPERPAGHGGARDGGETVRRPSRPGRSLARQVPSVHVGRRRSPVDRGPDALRELRSLRGGRLPDVHAVQRDLQRARLHEARLVPFPKDIGVDSPPDYACPTRAA